MIVKGATRLLGEEVLIATERGEMLREETQVGREETSVMREQESIPREQIGPSPERALLR